MGTVGTIAPDQGGKTFARGLNFLGTYTWSKTAQTDASDFAQRRKQARLPGPDVPGVGIQKDYGLAFVRHSERHSTLAAVTSSPSEKSKRYMSADGRLANARRRMERHLERHPARVADRLPSLAHGHSPTEQGCNALVNQGTDVQAGTAHRLEWKAAVGRNPAAFTQPCKLVIRRHCPTLPVGRRDAFLD